MHTHPCPSERCQGAQHPCNQVIDCQPGPALCIACHMIADDLALQRSAWRAVDKVLQTGVRTS